MLKFTDVIFGRGAPGMVMQTQSAGTLLEGAKTLAPVIVNWRRTIHQTPELSFQERRTGTYIAEQLRKMGLKPTMEVGGTGVTAEIGTTGPTVGLRADMDALPIKEANKTDYVSSCEGV